MRKLASIRVIKEINEHGNADSLELISIDGWTVVVRKGEYKAGDVVVFLEIDSWAPTAIAPFLTKPGKEPKDFNGVKGERLRTAKLRGVTSQGLVLPLSVLPEQYITKPDEHGMSHWDMIGMDVTDLLGILKYEKPLPACLVGMAKGVFPSWIPKTDQTRIQNLFYELSDEQINDTYEVTLKLDGSSATYYVKDGEVGVCSRNLELKLDEGNAENSFVKMFNQLGLRGKLLAYYERTGRSIALQAELWGSNINGNHEGVHGHHYSVFDIWDIDKQEYLDWLDRKWLCVELGIDRVPYIELTTLERFKTVEDLLSYADRGSIFNKVAEGVVFKSTTNPNFSFKCISNSFLLSKGE